jgi:hypothetical protein
MVGKERVKFAGWIGAILLLAMLLVLSSTFRAPEQNEPVGLLVVGTLVDDVGAFKESELKLYLVMDSQVYRSKQEWNATVFIDSPENITGAEVWLKGILSDGNLKLLKREDLDLKKGANIVIFKGSMPSCYGCARITESFYNVSSSITLEGEVLAEDIEMVELRK